MIYITVSFLHTSKVYISIETYESLLFYKFDWCLWLVRMTITLDWQKTDLWMWQTRYSNSDRIPSDLGAEVLVYPDSRRETRRLDWWVRRTWCSGGQGQSQPSRRTTHWRLVQDHAIVHAHCTHRHPEKNNSENKMKINNHIIIKT